MNRLGLISVERLQRRMGSLYARTYNVRTLVDIFCRFKLEIPIQHTALHSLANKSQYTIPQSGKMSMSVAT